jgi:hypothetical protein
VLANEDDEDDEGDEDGAIPTGRYNIKRITVRLETTR